MQEDAIGEIEWPTVFFIIEILDRFVVIVFTIEYLMRLIVCPRKLKFLKVDHYCGLIWV